MSIARQGCLTYGAEGLGDYGFGVTGEELDGLCRAEGRGGGEEEEGGEHCRCLRRNYMRELVERGCDIKLPIT